MFTKDCFRVIDAFKAQTRRKPEPDERYKEMQQILSRAIIAPEDQERADELMK